MSDRSQRQDYNERRREFLLFREKFLLLLGGGGLVVILVASFLLDLSKNANLLTALAILFGGLLGAPLVMRWDERKNGDR